MSVHARNRLWSLAIGLGLMGIAILPSHPPVLEEVIGKFLMAASYFGIGWLSGTGR